MRPLPAVDVCMQLQLCRGGRRRCNLACRLLLLLPLAQCAPSCPLPSCPPLSVVSGGVSGNLLQVARSVVANHGAGALYRGFRASLVGDVLGNSLGFTCYEMGHRWVHAQAQARWQGGEGCRGREWL